MEKCADVIIIGGGLAGLTAALHLSKHNLDVTLIEKNEYPRHKVCGEYVSNEILTYLQSLDADMDDLEPTRIEELRLTTQSGKALNIVLPLGGRGVSRYALDDFLYKKIKVNGCNFIQATVTGVSFDEDIFTVLIQNRTLKAKIVLSAYGKRANIDQLLARDFMHKPSPYMAVKAHYRGTFPSDLIALHTFKGGYCGISKVENDRINVCYLADMKSFKKYKKIEEYQHQVIYKNKNLQDFFENNTLLFEKPIAISQVSFAKKKPIEQHMIMIGDAAGLIHPLCGNGMAMAVHSAKIAAELTIDYYLGKIKSRGLLEQSYTTQWQQNFRKRLLIGRILARVFKYDFIASGCIGILARFPQLLTWIIKQTHGHSITAR